MRDPKRILSDLLSYFNIMLGNEKHNKGFEITNVQFQKAAKKYKKQGYSLDTTGLSLGGALATHVSQSNPNQVHEDLSFSRGSGFAEPFRKGHELLGTTLVQRQEGGHIANSFHVNINILI